jgi:purine nucleosidase
VITIAIALDPQVATQTEQLFVDIETESSLCRGQSVVDHLHVLGREPNAEVVREASRQRFLNMLHEAVC